MYILFKGILPLQYIEEVLDIYKENNYIFHTSPRDTNKGKINKRGLRGLMGSLNGKGFTNRIGGRMFSTKSEGNNINNNNMVSNYTMDEKFKKLPKFTEVFYNQELLMDILKEGKSLEGKKIIKSGQSPRRSPSPTCIGRKGEGVTVVEDQINSRFEKLLIFLVVSKNWIFKKKYQENIRKLFS